MMFMMKATTNRCDDLALDHSEYDSVPDIIAAPTT